MKLNDFVVALHDEAEANRKERERVRRKEDEESAEIHTERPEEILLKVLPTLLTVVTWAALVFAILLLKSRGIIT